MNKLDSEVVSFVAEHPDGWSHEDWGRLLDQLSVMKVKVGDVDELGVRLEAERLRQFLLRCGVKGLGPKRVAAIVERYGNLWNLRHEPAAGLTAVPTHPCCAWRRRHWPVFPPDDLMMRPPLLGRVPRERIEQRGRAPRRRTMTTLAVKAD
jgi:hypothetical protein